MVKFINTKKIKITLVLRHYWEKKGRWTNILVSYTFGIQLGWVKFWVSVGRKK